MGRAWTDNQLKAINASSGALLVSAAAGSGKTAVLVERVVRMVTDTEKPLSIDRLLVVTYTRAAAAELRDRLGKSLDELIKSDPHNSWYKKQLCNLPYANISTVDSYCSNIVREFFGHLDIASDFRIADEGELSVLKNKAVEVTLDKLYAEGSSEFYQFVESFSSARNDNKIQDIIFKLYEFLCSHPFMDKWLDDKLSYYRDADNAADSVWGRVISDYALSAVDYLLSLSRSSLEILEEEPELYSKVYSLIDSDILFLETLYDKLTGGTWDDVYEHLGTFEPGRLVAKGYKEHPIKLRVSANRDILKDTLKSINKLYVQNESQVMADIKEQLPVVKKVFESVRIFSDEYQRLKRSKNIADFSDVEHCMLHLLVRLDDNGEVCFTDDARLISDRYDAVMVDEYQDANEVQDLIFRGVSTEGERLFVVGDVKQSIYGFRQAMPEIFLGRKNSMPLYDQDNEKFPSKIILEKNFRSRREVTDIINFIFEKLMSTETGDLDYNDEEKLYAAKPYPDTTGPCVEMHLLDLDSIGDIDASVAEARHIASLVGRLCSETYIGEGDELRLCTPSDIAILMRNPKNYADIYITELKRFGVDAVCESSSGFLASGHIMLAMSFIRATDNPLDDISLAAVMMSAVYGFTLDDLAHIKAPDKKSHLYTALLSYAQGGNEKAQRFLSQLDYLRDISLTLPADRFITAMYDYVGLPEICSAVYGADCISDLRLLTEYARSYEQGGAKGIGPFVGFIEKLSEDKSDLAASAKTTEHSCAVRLMSIHASKGLEFPVCILANTAHKFKTDTTDNVLLHSKLGFASKRHDRELCVNYPTVTRAALSLELMRSEKSEELRVLYVALTRAKERLIMIASEKKLSGYIGKIYSSLTGDGDISPFLVRDCKRLSDWLIMTALLHPDGDKLRELAGADDICVPRDDNVGRLGVEIVQSLETGTRSVGEAVTSHTIYEDVDDNIAEIIRDRFDFVYPYSEQCRIPVKVTASELAHKFTDKRFARTLRKPMFMRDERLSAAEQGTATHLFLEKCDFLRAADDLLSEIERLRSNGVLDDAQSDALKLGRLASFFESGIIELVRRSTEYHREFRFTVNIPAHLADESLDGDHSTSSIILQGAADLVIVDSEGIVVVDYKTDRVHDTDILVELYKKQLELYKYALEQIFSLPVKKCLIYSVHLAEIKEVI